MLQPILPLAVSVQYPLAPPTDGCRRHPVQLVGGGDEAGWEQQVAVEVITEAGGQVLYDYELDEAGNEIQGTRPPGPSWLRHNGATGSGALLP